MEDENDASLTLSEQAWQVHPRPLLAHSVFCQAPAPRPRPRLRLCLVGGSSTLASCTLVHSKPQEEHRMYSNHGWMYAETLEAR